MKRVVKLVLLIGVMFLPTVESNALGLAKGPQLKIETILMDRIYKNIYCNFYEKTVEEEGITGQEVADYACRFIGNPYVWGGTSLTEGADCSGFVQSVYKHFGIHIPRTSFSQRSAGQAVLYKNVEIGDLVCYEGHVGIYIGNGKIVNARSPEEGIGITSAMYDQILTVRRLIN